MATPQVRDKYYLRSLHEEIDLFDRKLAHLLKYEAFPSEKERNAAAAKMSVKRGQLVKTAQQLAEEGIEFQSSQLPRSLRSDEVVEAPAALPVEVNEAVVMAGAPPVAANSAYAGTSLDFRSHFKEYLEMRKKARAQ